MTKFSNKNLNDGGFTIIEMVIVVGIISIFAGFVISFVNYNQQRGRANDTILTGRIEQLSQAIESYNQTVDTYPAENSGIPVSNSDFTKFVATWPAGYTYKYDNTAKQFAIYIANSGGKYIKYSSVWGKVRVCSSIDINVVATCN